MFFVLLTFTAALFIEGLGSLVSVIGISALFGANPIIIALAISLDVGKIVVVSLLYSYWNKLSFLMRTYGLCAAVVTMTITSAGAAGYLSGQFQKAIIGAKEGELNVGVLKEQQTRLLERKKQIDDQIAKLPSNYSRARIALMRQFEGEQKAVTEQLASIDKQLPEAQLKQISTEAKAGPIIYISQAFNISVEHAVKWVILMIIFVFDPLAIFLIIAGNFLWAHRKKNNKLSQPPPAPQPLPDLSPPEPPAPARPVPPPSRVIRENHIPERPPPIVPVHEPEKQPLEQHNESFEEHLHVYEEEQLKIDEPVSPSNESGLLSPIDPDPEPIPLGHEIAKSSLSDVPPDPRTIVDAGHTQGYRKSTIVPSIKKSSEDPDIP